MKYAIATKQVVRLSTSSPLYSGETFKGIVADAVIMTAINKSFGASYFGGICAIFQYISRCAENDEEADVERAMASLVPMGLSESDSMLVASCSLQILAGAFEILEGVEDPQQQIVVLKQAILNILALCLSSNLTRFSRVLTGLPAEDIIPAIHNQDLISAVQTWSFEDPRLVDSLVKVGAQELGMINNEHFIAHSGFDMPTLRGALERSGLKDMIASWGDRLDEARSIDLVRTFCRCHQNDEDNPYRFVDPQDNHILIVEEKDLEITLRSIMDEDVDRSSLERILAAPLVDMATSRELSYSYTDIANSIVGLGDLSDEDIITSNLIQIKPLELEGGLSAGPFKAFSDQRVELTEEVLTKIMALTSEVFEDGSDDFMSFMEEF